MKSTEKPNLTGRRFGTTYFLFFAIYGISPYLQVILRRLGYSPAAVGLFLGIFELVGIAGPIVLARKADALGRFNPFLIGSGLGIILGMGLLVSVNHAIAAVVGLSFASLGLKTPVPVLDTALLRAIESDQKEGKATPSYGLMRSIGSLGFVIVTLIVQFVPGFEASSPMVMAGVMALLASVFLVGIKWLPESGDRITGKKKQKASFGWIDTAFLLGLAVIMLGRIAMAPVNSFFSLYLVESLEWQAIGAMAALGAVVEIPMMLLAWRYMSKKSPMQAISLASGAIVLRLLIYALVPTKTGAVVGQLLHSLCYGLFQPAAVAFVNLKTPPTERTTGMAILLGIGMGLPAFLGSALGGLIVEWAGYRWLFASFSLFAMGSLALYYSKRSALNAVR
ncbi:MAG: MFS transporter [Spirochaetia bacterium]|jgi:PPP family 3-phenylpropionic acid transporter|nr:MFS transporter [Spirochaetales bacterium]MDX9783256.1 MFS transporter [Spirochaetia bacterium]